MTNKPEMKPVASTMVAAIGYDDVHQALWVEYNGGKLYVYEGVEPSRFAECDLLNPTFSVGKWVNKEIKPNYPCSRLEG